MVPDAESCSALQVFTATNGAALVSACAGGDAQACRNLAIGVGAVTVAHFPQRPDRLPPALVAAAPSMRPLKPGEAGLSGCNDHLVPSHSTQAFVGDLAVTSSWNLDTNYFTYFDVTDPTQPCVLGDATLTANPETLNTFTNHGTIHIQGSARGVAVLQYDGGIAAFAGIAEGGLAAADVGGGIPSVLPANREPPGFASGDYSDVVAVDDRLVALNNNFGGIPSLEILDPNLGQIASIALDFSTKVNRVIVARSVWVDLNANQRIDSGEDVHVGLRRRLRWDHDRRSSPRSMSPRAPSGQFRMPGIIRELTVDNSGARS